MLAVTLRENALTTLDALKTSLGIDPAEEDAQRDATLVQLINAASAWLETQLGRKLGKSTYRQRYCGTGTQQLSLEQYPIVSVERITDTFTGETITDFDFNETGEIGVLFREDGWTYRGHIGGLAYDYIAPRKYLEVQYVAGYILPKDATEDHPATLPADLEAIVWYMIAQQWAIIENDAAGLSAFSISDVSWTFDKNISETWQSVISKYQRWYPARHPEWLRKEEAVMASNIEVASYDPKKVNLVMNGKIITGFASDSMITIACNEDTVTTQVGVKGDVAYNENANESGTITVTLMGTSSSLPYVRSLALKRKEVSVMIVDANDSASVNVAEERCRVIKPPDITRAKEIGSESVSIFVPSLNYR